MESLEKQGAEISAQSLLYRLETGNLPFLLDVRTEEERKEWELESAKPIERMNIPYIEFIEASKEPIARTAA